MQVGKMHTRNIGIDLAKIIAMVFVVALHVNSSGLANSNMATMPFGYRLIRGMATTCSMTCIDIFAIVSGFVGVATSFSVVRIARLWLRVMFTCVTVTAITSLCLGVHIRIDDWVRCFMPIAGNQYWYMTDYFLLLFIMPFVNAGIGQIKRRELEKIIGLILGIICIPALVGIKGSLGIRAGYSFGWLLVLYILGAYIRLYNPLANISRGGGILVAVACIFAGGVMPLFVDERFCFVGYTSPITLVLAICILHLLLMVKIENKRIRSLIFQLSSTSLAVYLVHNTPVFWNHVFGRLVNSCAAPDVWAWAIKGLSLTILFYLAGTIFDVLRKILFAAISKMIKFDL